MKKRKRSNRVWEAVAFIVQHRGHTDTMNRDQSVGSQHISSVQFPDGWPPMTVADLFIATPITPVHVELVDDPGAIPRISSDSLLTELLCEV